MAKKEPAKDRPKSKSIFGIITAAILKDPNKASLTNVDRGTASDADRRGKTPKAKKAKHAPEYYQPGDRYRAGRGE